MKEGTKLICNLPLVEQTRIAQEVKMSELDVDILVSGTIGLINAVLSMEPDIIVFLDKSERPGAYLFRRVWKGIFPDRRRPGIRYMNIPKKLSNPVGNDHLPDAVRGVRRNLSRGLRGDESIMVVDEIMESGGTAETATKVIAKAFPGATILEPQSNFAKLPQWYGADNLLGVIEKGEEDDMVVKRERGEGIEDDMVVKRDEDNRKAFFDHRGRLSNLAQVIVSNAVISSNVSLESSHHPIQ